MMKMTFSRPTLLKCVRKIVFRFNTVYKSQNITFIILTLSAKDDIEFQKFRRNLIWGPILFQNRCVCLIWKIYDIKQIKILAERNSNHCQKSTLSKLLVLFLENFFEIEGISVYRHKNILSQFYPHFLKLGIFKHIILLRFLENTIFNIMPNF